MGYTSTAVKAKYNKKTYTAWSVSIRNECAEIIEQCREKEGLSRAEFIKMLVAEKYGITFPEPPTK